MEFLAGLFILIVVGMVGDTIVKVAKARAGARQGLPAMSTEVEVLRRQADEQAAVLADTQAALANQTEQIQEIQERLDFAERLLVQVRDRPTLGAGERPPV